MKGSPAEPVFAADNISISSASGPIKVKAHFCPKVADWDLDCLWDIVAGCDDGSVTWYRNCGAAGEPQFEDARNLLPAHEGSGYSYLVTSQADIVPVFERRWKCATGIPTGSRICCVGDFYTCFHLRQDLPAERLQAARNLLQRYNAAAAGVSGPWRIFEEFCGQVSRDAIYSEEADRECRWLTRS